VRAALARAEAERMDAEAAWKRARQLQSSQVLSEAEADTLKAALKAAQANYDAASADLADHQIRAPFAGVVGLRRVNEGAYVKAVVSIPRLMICTSCGGCSRCRRNTSASWPTARKWKSPVPATATNVLSVRCRALIRASMRSIAPLPSRRTSTTAKACCVPASSCNFTCAPANAARQ